MKIIIFFFSLVFIFCFISCKSETEKKSKEQTQPEAKQNQPEAKQTQAEKKSEPSLAPNTKPVIPTKTKQTENDCLLNGMYYSDGTTYGKSLCRQGEWITQ